jgi:hypothetical protein
MGNFGYYLVIRLIGLHEASSVLLPFLIRPWPTSHPRPSLWLLTQFLNSKEVMLFQAFAPVRFQSTFSFSNLTDHHISVLAKCKQSLHDGRRLENISWRLWYCQVAATPRFWERKEGSFLDEKTEQQPLLQPGESTFSLHSLSSFLIELIYFSSRHPWTQ